MSLYEHFVRCVGSRLTHLPVILMTGYAERLEQTIRAQLEVLPKPCSFETLVATIDKAVSRKREAVGLTPKS